MNVENILKVADAIEQHSIPDLGFNMSAWIGEIYKDRSGHKCGTTACVGGWAYVIATGKKTYPFQGDLVSIAAEFLGLDYETSDLLFEPGNPDSWDKIKPIQAVRTLRYLAKTGIVNWNLPEPA